MTTQTSPAPATAEQFGQMMQMMTGYWVSQSIYAGAKLGLADLLKDGPMPARKVADKLSGSEDFLYRLMRALGCLGILVEEPGKTFRLSPLGELLRSDHPASMRPIALMLGEEHYASWGRLSDSMLTGKIPFETVYGEGCFEYFETHPEASETFNQAMTALVQNEIAVVASAYDFSGFERLVDVGGGHGRLLAGILKRNPKLSGTVFDLPHVVEGATVHFKAEGVDNRAVAEGGDFFKSVPQGDAYIMSHIIHDWSDEMSTKILANIHKAMAPNGTLLLAETVIASGGQPVVMGPLMDLNMLVMTPGGRERTEEEYRELLAGAGFKLTRVIPVTPTVSLVEAVKK